VFFISIYVRGSNGLLFTLGTGEACTAAFPRATELRRLHKYNPIPKTESSARTAAATAMPVFHLSPLLCAVALLTDLASASAVTRGGGGAVEGFGIDADVGEGGGDVVASIVLEVCDELVGVGVGVVEVALDDAIFAALGVMLKYWLSNKSTVPVWTMPKKKSEPLLRSNFGFPPTPLMSTGQMNDVVLASASEH